MVCLVSSLGRRNCNLSKSVPICSYEILRAITMALSPVCFGMLMTSIAMNRTTHFEDCPRHSVLWQLTSHSSLIDELLTVSSSFISCLLLIVATSEDHNMSQAALGCLVNIGTTSSGRESVLNRREVYGGRSAAYVLVRLYVYFPHYTESFPPTRSLGSSTQSKWFSRIPRSCLVSHQQLHLRC